MIDFQLPKANFVGPVAEVETVDTYEERLEYYQERNYTYIPLPVSKQYYDVEVDEIRPFSRKQFLHEDHSIMKVWYALTEYPFVLVERPLRRKYWVADGEFGLGSPEEDKEAETYSIPWAIPHRYPEIDAEDLLPYESERYRILTLADLNRRKSKEILFSIVSAVENVFSSKVEDYFDTDELLPRVGAETVGRWYKARSGDVNLHIAEFMSTGRLKSLIENTPDIYEDLGFSSRNQFSNCFSGFGDLRNSVMHTNRSVVRNKEDLHQQLERIERLYEFLRSDPVDLFTQSEPYELARTIDEEEDQIPTEPIYADDYDHRQYYQDSVDEDIFEWEKELER